MNLNDETYDRLVSKIFSAALDSAQWRGFLDTLGAVSGGVRTHILGHDMRAGFSLPAVYSGYDREYVASWDAHFGYRNAWAQGFFEAPAGRAIPAEAMCEADALQRTEFYNDWVRPQEDIRGGGGVVLSKGAASFFALGGNIRAKDADALQAPFLALVQRLTPHLQAALAISRRIGTLEIENTILERAGSGPQAAVLLLNTRRDLVYGNGAARADLAAGTALRCDFRGRVRFADANADRRLAAALSGLSRFPGPPAPRSQTFLLPGPGAARLCRMARLDLPDLAQHPALALSGALSEPCLLVTLCAAFCESTAISVLMSDYTLTRAEAEIAASIAAGRRLRDLAEARGTSHHTVRNQLKSVLSKTHQHSQRDLTRLVLQLAR